MLRATTIIRKAAVRADRVADAVTLDHAARRVEGEREMHGAALTFLLAPPRAAELEPGDALRLEDGRLVEVRAAEEALLEVSAENPSRLMRLAWQLGSNHVPAELGAEALHVPDTPANAELVRGLGCLARPVMRAFRPERAVHAHDHATCGHDHRGHDHHAHGHDHHHDHHHHAHEHSPGHDHGPGRHRHDHAAD